MTKGEYNTVGSISHRSLEQKYPKLLSSLLTFCNTRYIISTIILATQNGDTLYKVRSRAMRIVHVTIIDLA
jgi:hypothetical protein